MGVDITMMVVNHKNLSEVIMEDLYTGRNYDFFSILQDREEVSFPCHNGLPEEMTEGEMFDLWKSGNYYDFHYITIKDFLQWINDYKPYLDAGWVTKYDAWQYNTRRIIPELYHYCPDSAVAGEYEFIEVYDKYDPFLAVRDELDEHFKKQNGDFRTVAVNQRWDDFLNNYIVYCFDC